MVAHITLLYWLILIFNIFVKLQRAFQAYCRIARKLVFIALLILKIHAIIFILLWIIQLPTLHNQNLIREPQARQALIRKVFKQISIFLRANDPTVFDSRVKTAILLNMSSIGEKQLRYEHKVLSYSPALLLSHVGWQVLRFKSWVEVILP
jgi:hypothetical protein